MGRKVKEKKIVLESFGNFLDTEKGCIILRDRKGKTTRHPLFEVEIGEVVLKSGNLVSTGVLTALGFWEIDVLLETLIDEEALLLGRYLRNEKENWSPRIGIPL
jgi:hypothetical protein